MKKVALIAGALVLGVTSIAVASTRDAAVPKASLTSTVKVHDGKPLGAHSVGHIQLKNSVIDCQKLVPSLRSAVCSLSLIPTVARATRATRARAVSTVRSARTAPMALPAKGDKGDKGPKDQDASVRVLARATRCYVTATTATPGAALVGGHSPRLGIARWRHRLVARPWSAFIGGGVQLPATSSRSAGTVVNAYVGETRQSIRRLPRPHELGATNSGGPRSVLRLRGRLGECRPASTPPRPLTCASG